MENMENNNKEDSSEETLNSLREKIKKLEEEHKGDTKATQGFKDRESVGGGDTSLKSNEEIEKEILETEEEIRKIEKKKKTESLKEKIKRLEEEHKGDTKATQGFKDRDSVGDGDTSLKSNEEIEKEILETEEEIRKIENEGKEKKPTTEDLISQTESFEDLYHAIEENNISIDGSEEVFDAEKLKDIVNKIKSGEFVLQNATRNKGFRDKISELLQKESLDAPKEKKPTTEKGDLPEEEDTENKYKYHDLDGQVEELKGVAGMKEEEAEGGGEEELSEEDYMKTGYHSLYDQISDLEDAYGGVSMDKDNVSGTETDEDREWAPVPAVIEEGGLPAVVEGEKQEPDPEPEPNPEIENIMERLGEINRRIEEHRKEYAKMVVVNERLIKIDAYGDGEKAKEEYSMGEYLSAIDEKRELLTDVLEGRYEEIAEEIREEEGIQEIGDLIKKSICIEATKLNDEKTNERLKESEGSNYRKALNKMKEYVEWYQRLPFKYKLAASAALLGGGAGAVALGGGLGAGLAGVVASLSLGKSALFGGSAGLSTEAFLKKRQEKGEEKETLEEFGVEDFIDRIEGNDIQKINDKLLELEGGKDAKKRRRGWAAVAVGAGVTVGLRGSSFIYDFFSDADVGEAADGSPSPEESPYSKEVRQGVDMSHLDPTLSPEGEDVMAGKESIENDYKYEVKQGDSLWKIIDEGMNDKYGDSFSNLPEGEKTYIIDSIKEKVAQNPSGFGIKDNIDTIHPGDEINLSSALNDEKFMESVAYSAEQLGEADLENIENANEKIREWVRENPNERLTTDKVKEILSGIPEEERPSLQEVDSISPEEEVDSPATKEGVTETSLKEKDVAYKERMNLLQNLDEKYNIGENYSQNASLVEALIEGEVYPEDVFSWAEQEKGVSLTDTEKEKLMERMKESIDGFRGTRFNFILQQTSKAGISNAIIEIFSSTTEEIGEEVADMGVEEIHEARNSFLQSFNEKFEVAEELKTNTPIIDSLVEGNVSEEELFEWLESEDIPLEEESRDKLREGIALAESDPNYGRKVINDALDSIIINKNK